MTALYTWMRSDRRARPRAYAVVVVVCLVLLALLAVIQVAHVHSVNTDADHCPLCIVLHTAAPISAAVVAIVLVQLESIELLAAVFPIATRWHPQLFIRPPPSL